MNPAIAKRMALIAEWQDRGYRRGVEDSKRGMDELKKKAADLFKVIAAGAAAFVGITAGFMKMVQAGSEIKSVADSWEGFRMSVGLSEDTLDRIDKAVMHTVSRLDIMNTSVRALSGGLQPELLVEFWEKSKQIADVSSQDQLAVFQQLSLAVNKVEYQTLETIGITVKAGEANKNFANAIGKTVMQLTLQEQRMAMLAAIEDQYRKNFQSVGDVTTRVREKFQQLTSGVKNLWHRFLVMVAESPKVMGFLSFLTGEIGELETSLESMRPQLDRAIATLILLGQKGVKAGKGIWGARNEIGLLVTFIVGTEVIERLTKTAKALGLISASGITVGGAITAIIVSLGLLVFNYQKVLKELINNTQAFFDWALEGLANDLRALGDLAQYLPLMGGEYWGPRMDEAANLIIEYRDKSFLAFERVKKEIDTWPKVDILGSIFGSKSENEAEAAKIEEQIDRIIGGLGKTFDEWAEQARTRAEREKAELLKLQELLGEPLAPKFIGIRLKTRTECETREFEDAIAQMRGIIREKTTGLDLPYEIKLKVAAEYGIEQLEAITTQMRAAAMGFKTGLGALSLPIRMQLLAQYETGELESIISEARSTAMDRVAKLGPLPFAIKMQFLAQYEAEQLTETINQMKESADRQIAGFGPLSFPIRIQFDELKKETLRSETDELKDQLDIRAEYVRNFAEIEMAANEWRHQGLIAMMRSETNDFRRTYAIRQEAYRGAIFAMSMYGDAFFKHSVKRSHALNAILIAGWTEALASYIEMKTEQFKIDAIEYAYQAVVAAAKGQWGLAAGFTQAAIMAGAAGGAGAIAAGFIRAYGEKRAEALIRQPEPTIEGMGIAGEEELIRQRRQATGVVNTRPIMINVYSTANFNAGYMIFGDSEAAANDLYEDHIRERIEDDIESSVIQIPTT